MFSSAKNTRSAWHVNARPAAIHFCYPSHGKMGIMFWHKVGNKSFPHKTSPCRTSFRVIMAYFLRAKLKIEFHRACSFYICKVLTECRRKWELVHLLHLHRLDVCKLPGSQAYCICQNNWVSKAFQHGKACMVHVHLLLCHVYGWKSIAISAIRIFKRNLFLFCSK